MFAMNGLEFCGMDQRGYGSSEGVRGKIESLESVLGDLHTFNLKYQTQFGNNQDGKQVPIFLLGNSMGGLYATHLAEQFPDVYKGLCLLAPSFSLANPRMMNDILRGL